MKKSNALMFSYMIFLIISLAANLIFKWDGLEKIALAATASSCFFAFADIINWATSFSKQLLNSEEDILQSFVKSDNSIKEINDYQIEQCSEIIKYSSTYKGKDKDLDSIFDFAVETLESCKEKTDYLENAYKDNNAKIAKIKRKKDRLIICDIIEFVFTVLGFAAFFIVIAFNKVLDILMLYQSYATIIAFIIIVFNYYLKETLEDNVLNKINEMKQQAYSREEKIRKGPLDIQKYDLLLRVKELINVIDQGLIDETNKD